MPTTLNTQETHLRVLRLLEAEPELTQRELASRLGISLGKANYCVREKLTATRRFLQREEAEYEELTQEIQRLRSELAEEATALPEQQADEAS